MKKHIMGSDLSPVFIKVAAHARVRTLPGHSASHHSILAQCGLFCFSHVATEEGSSTADLSLIIQSNSVPKLESSSFAVCFWPPFSGSDNSAFD
ncbi:hypothetical protein ACOSQ4_023560 [Xanthoceras sorbifolium]